MTTTELALAQRLAAVPGIWRAGMLTTCRLRVIETCGRGLIGWTPGATRDGGGWLDTDNTDGLGLVPDLTDPATRGALLDVARNKHHTFASPEYLGAGGWRFGPFRADTEGAAIALAILGAP